MIKGSWNDIDYECNTYRPYLWLGEDADAHVADWRQRQLSQQGGGASPFQTLYALQQAGMTDAMQRAYSFGIMQYESGTHRQLAQARQSQLAQMLNDPNYSIGGRRHAMDLWQSLLNGAGTIWR